tara:strand:- start:521 stop:1144 length:624 start_codon:yes stop_codon:yes gene_type:complete
MISNLYDKFVLPKLLDVCCSTKPINYQRNKIVPNAKGDILEVGIGSGLNIPYYDPKKINKIIGLDPSEELNEMAKENAAKSDINIDILIAGAEEIPLPSNSIDTVLITYSLCTIPNLADSLKEIKRVMKNDAEMIFCEHGIAPDLRIQNWQNKINPLWGKLFGGCNINRDIPKILVNSEFKIQTLEQMYLPSTPKIVGYNYWGLAKI